jgi:hypothetical protein
MADPEKQPEQPKAAQQKQVIGKFYKSPGDLVICDGIQIFCLLQLVRTPPSFERLQLHMWPSFEC